MMEVICGQLLRTVLIRGTVTVVLKKARVHFQPQARLRSAQQSSFMLEGPLGATGLQIYRDLGCVFLPRSPW